MKKYKISKIILILILNYFLLFEIQSPAFARKYIQYNLFNLMFDNDNYVSNFDSGSLTIGGSESVFKKSFFEISIFMDISFFVFQEVKSLEAIQDEIRDLAKTLKPKIQNEKNSIIQQIETLQQNYDASIIGLNKIPGDSEARMHNQINELYKNLINYENYEKQLDQKINTSITNYQSTTNTNNQQRDAVKGFITDTSNLIGSFATQTLATSSSTSANKATSIMGGGGAGGKIQAAVEIAKLGANTITDIVYDIKNIEARSSFLEEQSKLGLERTAIELKEVALLSEIDAIENLKKTDVDSSNNLNDIQDLYNKLDLIKKAKTILTEKKEITDTFIRIPIAIGPVFNFQIFSFLFAYVELGFLISLENSIIRTFNNINFGCRVGTGINFELFSQRFIIGIHFRYWGLEKHFMSIGPSLGIKI